MNLTTVRMMSQRQKVLGQSLEEMEFIGQKSMQKKQDENPRSALAHLRFRVIHEISLTLFSAPVTSGQTVSSTIP